MKKTWLNIGLLFVGGVKMLFAQQLATRPNILFIIADDWSYGHCSILGDSAVKTPTFDSLSKAGTFFYPSTLYSTVVYTIARIGFLSAH